MEGGKKHSNLRSGATVVETAASIKHGGKGHMVSINFPLRPLLPAFSPLSKDQMPLPNSTPSTKCAHGAWLHV